MVFNEPFSSVVASVVDDWTTLSELLRTADVCTDDFQSVWKPSSVEAVYSLLLIFEGVVAEVISLKPDVDEEASSILSFEDVEEKSLSVVESIFESVDTAGVLIEIGCEVVDGLVDSSSLFSTVKSEVEAEVAVKSRDVVKVLMLRDALKKSGTVLERDEESFVEACGESVVEVSTG